MAQMSYLALANDGILDLVEKATSKEVISNGQLRGIRRCFSILPNCFIED
jgi:hypothetical protein